MASFLDRLLGLWRNPDPEEAAFRQMYADPVQVNGAPLSITDLVTRARALHAAYSDVEFDVVDEVYAANRVVVGFRMRGRHAGPLATPLGIVAPTGRIVENRVTDILTVIDGLVTDIWVVSDDLSVLIQLDAIAFK